MDLDPSPCLRAALSRSPQLPRIARFACRVITIFSFTVASSVVSLVTVAVSYVVAARSLAMAVAKFTMVSIFY